MKGQFVGFQEVATCGYMKIWVDMMEMSIRHARKDDLTELTPSLRQRECYEARCYLLSDQFEDDCEWVDINDEAIGMARTCWEYRTDKSRCAVCGRKEARGLYACGRKVCWEHQQIIQAYNNGHDLDEVMKEIAKRAKKPAQMELQEFVQAKRMLNQKIVLTERGPRFAPKLTDEQRAYIRECYKAGRKARFLALRFGVTPRTINMVVK